MKKKYLLCLNLVFILILFYSSAQLNAQNSSFVENFDATLDTQAWKSGNNSTATTFHLSIENSTLKINYNRTEQSNAWDQFNLSFANPIDASNTKLIAIKIKSNFGFTISLKPIYGVGDDWLQKSIEGDNI